ncbi:hypothetical protein [Brevibacillus invocatus]|uniref:hypothetical protein n=1 Tax=Brevibacillus invocatus TaxID=173959 RepID=UPI002041220B|nr:hypothetical protein [Brevibacillus invocatus]MCM3080805.1 hypothetical protein [Brevibacillus invocatus]MCM3430992.1 hypothetical protein [Brevibacillus invocatus]
MFVKVYKYRIKPEREQEYLEIQKAAESIYERFVDKQSVHLKSKEDGSTWMEIHWYKDEPTYDQAVQLINEQEELQQLYREFMDILVSEENVLEENYLQVLRFVRFIHRE